MSWDSFSSFFQLAAAFCLTYTVIESFTAFFNKKILKVEDYFIGNLDDPHPETEKYREYIKIKNAAIDETKINRVVDPLGLEIKLLIERHRSFFFHAFLACILFLLFAAFENFYKEEGVVSLQVHQRFFGIILIPFISIWMFYYIFQPVKEESDILNELPKVYDRSHFIRQSKPSFKTCFRLLFLAFGLGTIIILIFYFFSIGEHYLANSCKFFMLFFILTILIPFYSTNRQMKQVVVRYENAAKVLLPNAGRVPSPKMDIINSIIDINSEVKKKTEEKE